MVSDRRAMKRFRRIWSDDDEARRAAGMKAGLVPSAIAAQLGGRRTRRLVLRIERCIGEIDDAMARVRR